MHFSTSFIVGCLVAVVSAQSAAQNATAASYAAQIPACALPCDDSAIKQIGCGLTDYACHCAHGSQLAILIPPCLEKSNCTAADLQVFGAIPAKICAALNGTASSNSTTSASTTTSTASVKYTTAGSATATPSGSSKSGSAPAPTSTNSAAMNSAASVLFVVIGAGVLGMFLPGL